MTAPSLKPFPDIELVLVAGLTPLIQAVYSQARIVTKLPASVTNPVIRVKRVAGANRDIVLDRPIVDVDTFYSDYGTASAIARQVTSSLLALRGQKLMNGVITNVSVVQGPRWLPDPDMNLNRFNASYELFTHG